MSTKQNQQGGRSGLRNRSGSQANTTPKVVASVSTNYEMSLQPIDEEAFKKADTDKKLDMIASAFNKINDTLNTKMDNIRTDMDLQNADLGKENR